LSYFCWLISPIIIVAIPNLFFSNFIFNFSSRHDLVRISRVANEKNNRFLRALYRIKREAAMEHDLYEVLWLRVAVWPTAPFLSLSFPHVHKNIAPSHHVPSTSFFIPIFSLIFILYLSNVLPTIYLRRQTIPHHITLFHIVIFAFHTCDTLGKMRIQNILTYTTKLFLFLFRDQLLKCLANCNLFIPFAQVEQLK